MSIFKAYDIRGKYPEELNEEKTFVIARSIARYLGVKAMAVGRDVRVSSEPIKEAFFRGLVAEGVAVTDLGVVTTPMAYFASGFYGFPATVMITASHNPPEYNGFKICREKAMALSENTGLREIERLVSDIPVPDASRLTHNAPAQFLDIRPEYKKFILGLLKETRPLKIAVDTANGSVGPIFDYVFSGALFKYVPLCFTPDGRFPNHEPNPMNEDNLRDIKQAIRRERADFGVAFDGDGDRCIFLDEQAERIPSDLVTALLGREFAAQSPGTTIIYDLRSSWAVREEIARAGGTPLRERVGHAFIKDTMRKHNAPFGGELSGHYYFRENYFADSALVAFVHFLKAVSRLNQPVSEIIRPLRRYAASGEINFTVTDKDDKIKQIARHFRDGKQDKLDGITVEYPDWWFNLRPSNTEPLLRLNLEAQTEVRLNKAKEEIIGIINR